MNLTATQTDAVQELLNIGVGRAASMLADMIQSPIRLQVPFVKLFTAKEIKEGLDGFDQKIKAIVELGFRGPFSGTAALLFPTESASKLVAALTGEELEDDDLDALTVGTLTEVGNIVMNGVMGSISNFIEGHIEYTVPTYIEDTVESILAARNSADEAIILLAQARFLIEDMQLEGDIMLVFEGDSLNAFLNAIELDVTNEG